MIIGLDIGRNKVKAYSKDHKIVFPSRVGEWRERKLTSGGDYELEYNGQKYFIGDLAEESYCVREMATESKIHDETKLLFLTVLAIANQSEYNVIIGLPVIQHILAVKESFITFLSGKYSVKLNGNWRHFSLSNISIVAESAGAYWSEVLNFRGEVINLSMTNDLVRIIDIGSRTINYCTINNKKYLDKDSGTLPYGTIELENAGNNKEQFSRKIIADLSKNLRNLNGTILFSGGGSILLYEYLKQQYPNSILCDDPLFANAKGFYKMGVARWAGK